MVTMVENNKHLEMSSMLDYIYVIITKNDGLPTQQEAAC